MSECAKHGTDLSDGITCPDCIAEVAALRAAGEYPGSAIDGPVDPQGGPSAGPQA